MKLIKLLQDRFVLVSDEEIKEGDLVLAKDTGTVFQCNKHEANKPIKQFKELYTKIISENPDFSLLSEEDCKTIGWVDVEKLAMDKTRNLAYGGVTASRSAECFIWKHGFKTAQSISDKRFSLDDMRKLASAAFTVKSHNETLIEDFDKWFNKRIQSLQQTSWNVEVEMNTWFKNGYDGQIVPTTPKITNGKLKIINIL